jgi:hypothetical protein
MYLGNSGEFRTARQHVSDPQEVHMLEDKNFNSIRLSDTDIGDDADVFWVSSYRGRLCGCLDSDSLSDMVHKLEKR